MWVFVGVLVVAGLVYIRLAPSDPARWHIDVAGGADKDFKAGVIRSASCGLAQLDTVAVASGARVLAGSVAESHITYISRSKAFGFPDYTTVQEHGGSLTILSRLRFGKSDMGVNKRRVEGWLAQL